MAEAGEKEDVGLLDRVSGPGSRATPLNLMATQSGEQHRGHVERSWMVVADGQEQLVTHPVSLEEAMTLGDGQVRLTVPDGPHQQVQTEL